MKRVIACAVTALALTACDPATSLPACPTEDSNGCAWDASQHGNGIGRSFVADDQGNVTYLP
jgi:hypothetical protein